MDKRVEHTQTVCQSIDLPDVLIEKQDEGWECCGIAPSINGQKYILIFKRPKRD